MNDIRCIDCACFFKDGGGEFCITEEDIYPVFFAEKLGYCVPFIGKEEIKMRNLLNEI